MTIRRLNAKDGAEYHALFLRGLHEHPHQFRVTPADVHDLPAPMETQGTDDFTLGAFDDEEMVGIVSLTRETRFRMRHKALLHRMYVSADVAGRGLGRGLLKTALSECANVTGLEQVILTVVANNARAQALYKSEGFIPFAHEPRALRYDTGYVDEIQMVRFLHQKQTVAP